VRNGIPWGKQGYVRYSDGSEYLGEWINGKRNGYGKHVMPNLDEYEGKFVGGLRCGYVFCSASLSLFVMSLSVCLSVFLLSIYCCLSAFSDTT
jgi:hypothetical protein